MKLRLPQRRVWRAAIYLGSLMLVLIALDLVLVQMRRRITPGFDTTRITGPLMPDGSIDYLTAIEEHFGQGVTPENNAAILLVQALGRQALPTNQPRDGITARLGMAPVPEKGEYFRRYEEYCTANSIPPEADPTDPRGPTTQPIPASPATARWISENEAPLGLIAQASKRSRFFMPFNGGTRPTTLVEVMIPYLRPLQDVRRALLIRAGTRLEAGDLAGFREDLLTMHRLARLLGQGATFIDRLFALEMEIATCRAERAAILGGKLPPDRLRSMADELASMPDLSSGDETVNAGERFMILDIFQTAARVGPARPLLLDMIASVNIQPNRWPGWNIAYRFWPVPYEECMRVMNRFYDGAIAAVHLPTYPQQRAALILWDKEVGKIQGRSFIPKMLSAEWPAQVFLPSMLGMVWRTEKARMERRLTQIALMLAVYKAERGTYPAALSDLSPAYLATVPNDSFSDQPPIYARRGEGYILYSVGPNMADDGGRKDKQADDVVASLP